MSDSLWPHGLYPTKLLCPWDFPGKNTGVHCHALLQRIFLTQGLNLCLLLLLHCRQILYSLSLWKPTIHRYYHSKIWLGRVLIFFLGMPSWKYLKTPLLWGPAVSSGKVPKGWMISAFSLVNITQLLPGKNCHLGLRSPTFTLIKMTVSNLFLFLLRWNQIKSQLSLCCVKKPSPCQTLDGTDVWDLPSLHLGVSRLGWRSLHFSKPQRPLLYVLQSPTYKWSKLWS